MKQAPILSISIPCFARPARTRRMMECFLKQTVNNFELIILGDGCLDFAELLESEFFNEWENKFKGLGNHLICFNKIFRHGGHGYACQNMAVHLATGEYFAFAANDDIYLPEHVAFYYNAIAGTDYDFVYVPSEVRCLNYIRHPKLQYGAIGHSELVIKTEFLKKLPPHDADYGHDWRYIENMIKAGGKHAPAFPPHPTYIVMSVPAAPEKGID